MKTPSAPLIRTIVFSLLLSAATFVASAANDTWTGTSSANWSNPGNWTGGNAPPLAGDSLVFGSSGPTTLNNDLAAALALSGFTFSGGTAFTLNGNSVLLSGSASNIIGILNNSGVGQVTGTMPLSLDKGYYTFSSPSGGTIALNGGLTLTLGGVAYFDGNVTSTSLTLDGTTGLINGLEGSGLIYNSGTGIPTDLATISGGSISIYSGYTTVASGAISSGNNMELTATGAAANYTANNIAVNSLRVLQAGNSTGTSPTTNVTTGTLTLGNNGGIYVFDSAAGSKNCFVLTGGGLTAGTSSGPASILFGVNGDNSNNQMQMSSALSNNVAGGSVSVVKAGNGSMFFSAANTYTGGTYVAQGELQGNNVGAFGAGAIFVSGGATLYFTPSGTIANALTLSPGRGTPYNVGGTIGSALVLGGAGNTLSGAIKLQGDPIVTSPSTLNGQALGDRITLVEGGNGHNFNINGQLTGTGTLDLYAPLHSENFFLGNTSLVTPNTFTGGLILETTQNTFSKLNAANQLNGGNVTLIGVSGKTCRLDLNGFSDTIGGLISGDLPAAIQFDNLGTVSCTITMGARDASGTYGGSIADNGVGKVMNLIKIGTGTQTLRGTDTCFGNVTVSNGVLALAVTATLPNAPIVTVAPVATLDGSGLNAGGFNVAAAQTLAGLGTVVGSTTVSGKINPLLGNIGALTNNGSLTFNGGGTYIWDMNNATGAAGNASGWSLLKINGGTLTVAANSGSQFNIKITSLNSTNGPGSASNFNNNNSNSWAIVQADSPISGFDPTAFHIDSSSFSNSIGSGAFALSLSPDQMKLLLTFTTSPVITTALTNQTKCAGSSVSFTVVANNATLPGLTFQWMEGVTVLNNGDTSAGGATVSISTSGHTSTLTLAGPGVQDADAGGFTVNVSNTAGSTGNSTATLTVIDPPSGLAVTQAPDTTVASGQVTRFTVTAAGTSPFTYQWSKNGVPLSNGGHISGATNATLAVEVSPADEGSYTVQVANGCGTATSTASVIGIVTSVPGQIIYEPFTSYVPQVMTPASTTWEGVTNLFNEQTGEPAWWFHSSGSGIKMIVQANDMNDGINNQNGGRYPWPGLAGNSSNCLYWTESLNSHLEFAQSGVATGTTIYVSFIMSCVSLGSVDGVTDVLAAFSSPNDGTAYNWKLCSVITNHSANQYTLGLSKGNGRTGAQGVDANTTWMATPVTAQQDLLIVGCYTVNSGGTTATDDTVSLWVNPDASTFGTGSVPAPDIGPSSFGVANSAIRDFAVHSVVAPASHRIADLRIGTTWASVLPPARPTLTLGNVSVNPGATAVFASQNSGNPIDTYQWSFNGGVPLTDNGHITGSSTATLTISNVQSADLGTYTVTGTSTDPINSTNWSGSASATLSFTSPPVLRVTAILPNVLLTWPTNAAGYLLEGSPSVAPATWTTNLPPYSLDSTGTNYVVTNNASTGQRYFRLIK